MSPWLWFLLAFGCASPSAQVAASEAGPGSPPAESYLHQTNRFERTWLFKPTEPESADMGYTLAPLVLQELTTLSKGEDADCRIGEVILSNGVPVIRLGRPSVYLKTDSVNLNGTPHARFTYVWFYAPRAFPGPLTALPFQGIRITLDDAGKPAIWEVLGETSGKDLLFVARHIEAAALSEYGQPCPGRRYAIERGFSESATAVVARVIEDGPIPMGPIVYLRSRTQSVETLICRCMPAEAAQVVGTSSYALISSASSPVDAVLATFAKAGWKSKFCNNPDGTERPLDRVLRLPKSF